jgi:hypothetical protein
MPNHWSCEGNKCWYKNGKCIKPTAKKLKLNTTKSYTAKELCNIVIGRGEQATQNMNLDGRIKNIVDFWLSNVPRWKVDPKYYEYRRDLILKKMNFKKMKTISADQILDILEWIDEYYFGSSLFVTLNNMDFIIDINIYYDDQIHNDISARVVYGDNMVALEINMNNWLHDNPKSNIDGVKCKNKFHALLITLEHELIHIMIYAFKPQGFAKSGHGYVFRTLNNVIFGHSDEIYTYQRHKVYSISNYENKTKQVKVKVKKEKIEKVKTKTKPKQIKVKKEKIEKVKTKTKTKQIKVKVKKEKIEKVKTKTKPKQIKVKVKKEKKKQKKLSIKLPIDYFDDRPIAQEVDYDNYESYYEPRYTVPKPIVKYDESDYSPMYSPSHSFDTKRKKKEINKRKNNFILY